MLLLIICIIILLIIFLYYFFKKRKEHFKTSISPEEKYDYKIYNYSNTTPLFSETHGFISASKLKTPYMISNKDISKALDFKNLKNDITQLKNSYNKYENTSNLLNAYELAHKKIEDSLEIFKKHYYDYSVLYDTDYFYKQEKVRPYLEQKSSKTICSIFDNYLSLEWLFHKEYIDNYSYNALKEFNKNKSYKELDNFLNRIKKYDSNGRCAFFNSQILHSIESLDENCMKLFNELDYELALSVYMNNNILSYNLKQNPDEMETVYTMSIKHIKLNSNIDNIEAYLKSTNKYNINEKELFKNNNTTIDEKTIQLDLKNYSKKYITLNDIKDKLGESDSFIKHLKETANKSLLFFDSDNSYYSCGSKIKRETFKGKYNSLYINIDDNSNLFNTCIWDVTKIIGSKDFKKNIFHTKKDRFLRFVYFEHDNDILKRLKLQNVSNPLSITNYGFQTSVSKTNENIADTILDLLDIYILQLNVSSKLINNNITILYSCLNNLYKVLNFNKKDVFECSNAFGSTTPEEKKESELINYLIPLVTRPEKYYNIYFNYNAIRDKSFPIFDLDTYNYLNEDYNEDKHLTSINIDTEIATSEKKFNKKELRLSKLYSYDNKTSNDIRFEYYQPRGTSVKYDTYSNKLRWLKEMKSKAKVLMGENKSTNEYDLDFFLNKTETILKNIIRLDDELLQLRIKIYKDMNNSGNYYEWGENNKYIEIDCHYDDKYTGLNSMNHQRTIVPGGRGKNERENRIVSIYSIHHIFNNDIVGKYVYKRSFSGKSYYEKLVLFDSNYTIYNKEKHRNTYMFYKHFNVFNNQHLNIKSEITADGMPDTYNQYHGIWILTYTENLWDLTIEQLLNENVDKILFFKIIYKPSPITLGDISKNIRAKVANNIYNRMNNDSPDYLNILFNAIDETNLTLNGLTTTKINTGYIDASNLNWYANINNKFKEFKSDQTNIIFKFIDYYKKLSNDSRIIKDNTGKSIWPLGADYYGITIENENTVSISNSFSTPTKTLGVSFHEYYRGAPLTKRGSSFKDHYKKQDPKATIKNISIPLVIKSYRKEPKFIYKSYNKIIVFYKKIFNILKHFKLDLSSSKEKDVMLVGGTFNSIINSVNKELILASVLNVNKRYNNSGYHVYLDKSKFNRPIYCYGLPHGNPKMIDRYLYKKLPFFQKKAIGITLKKGISEKLIQLTKYFNDCKKNNRHLYISSDDLKNTLLTYFPETDCFIDVKLPNIDKSINIKFADTMTKYMRMYNQFISNRENCMKLFLIGLFYMRLIHKKHFNIDNNKTINIDNDTLQFKECGSESYKYKYNCNQEIVAFIDYTLPDGKEQTNGFFGYLVNCNQGQVIFAYYHSSRNLVYMFLVEMPMDDILNERIKRKSYTIKEGKLLPGDLSLTINADTINKMWYSIKSKKIDKIKYKYSDEAKIIVHKNYKNEDVYKNVDLTQIHIKSAVNNFCLDFDGKNVKVFQVCSRRNTNQIWSANESLAYGLLKIKNKNRCLEKQNNNTVSVKKCAIFGDKTEIINNQKWKIEKNEDNTYSIRTADYYYLEKELDSNSVKLSKKNSSRRQKWIIDNLNISKEYDFSCGDPSVEYDSMLELTYNSIEKKILDSLVLELYDITSNKPLELYLSDSMFILPETKLTNRWSDSIFKTFCIYFNVSNPLKDFNIFNPLNDTDLNKSIKINYSEVISKIIRFKIEQPSVFNNISENFNFIKMEKEFDRFMFSKFPLDVLSTRLMDIYEKEKGTNTESKYITTACKNNAMFNKCVVGQVNRSNLSKEYNFCWRPIVSETKTPKSLASDYGYTIDCGISLPDTKESTELIGIGELESISIEKPKLDITLDTLTSFNEIKTIISNNIKEGTKEFNNYITHPKLKLNEVEINMSSQLQSTGIIEDPINNILKLLGNLGLPYPFNLKEEKITIDNNISYTINNYIESKYTLNNDIKIDQDMLIDYLQDYAEKIINEAREKIDITKFNPLKPFDMLNAVTKSSGMQWLLHKFPKLCVKYFEEEKKTLDLKNIADIKQKLDYIKERLKIYYIIKIKEKLTNLKKTLKAEKKKRKILMVLHYIRTRSKLYKEHFKSEDLSTNFKNELIFIVDFNGKHFKDYNNPEQKVKIQQATIKSLLGVTRELFDLSLPKPIDEYFVENVFMLIEPFIDSIKDQATSDVLIYKEFSGGIYNNLENILVKEGEFEITPKKIFEIIVVIIKYVLNLFLKSPISYLQDTDDKAPSIKQYLQKILYYINGFIHHPFSVCSFSISENYILYDNEFNTTNNMIQTPLFGLPSGSGFAVSDKIYDLDNPDSSIAQNNKADETTFESYPFVLPNIKLEYKNYPKNNCVHDIKKLYDSMINLDVNIVLNCKTDVDCYIESSVNIVESLESVQNLKVPSDISELTDINIKDLNNTSSEYKENLINLNTYKVNYDTTDGLKTSIENKTTETFKDPNFIDNVKDSQASYLYKSVPDLKNYTGVIPNKATDYFNTMFIGIRYGIDFEKAAETYYTAKKYIFPNTPDILSLDNIQEKLNGVKDAIHDMLPVNKITEKCEFAKDIISDIIRYEELENIVGSMPFDDFVKVVVDVVPVAEFANNPVAQIVTDLGPYGQEAFNGFTKIIDPNIDLPNFPAKKVMGNVTNRVKFCKFALKKGFPDPSNLDNIMKSYGEIFINPDLNSFSFEEFKNISVTFKPEELLNMAKKSGRAGLNSLKSVSRWVKNGKNPFTAGKIQGATTPIQNTAKIELSGGPFNRLLDKKFYTSLGNLLADLGDTIVNLDDKLKDAGKKLGCALGLGGCVSEKIPHYYSIEYADWKFEKDYGDTDNWSDSVKEAKQKFMIDNYFSKLYKYADLISRPSGINPISRMPWLIKVWIDEGDNLFVSQKEEIGFVKIKDLNVDMDL